VFSALNGSCPRTLTGHTAAVTDSAIIERGKHILTSSHDGTVKLWNVGESKCLKSWRVGKGSRKGVTKVLVVSSTDSNSLEHIPEDLKNKVAFAATEDGRLTLIDVSVSAANPPLHTIPVPPNSKAISALAYTESEKSPTLAIGTVNGFIYIYQWVSSSILQFKATPSVLARIKRNDADITFLSFLSSSETSEDTLQIVASTADGLPFQVSIDSTGMAKIEVEYAGYDIDSCNAIVPMEDSTYSAGKDGNLRRY